MPPHCWQAGPRSRPIRRAGTTGGVLVIADVGACADDWDSPPTPAGGAGCVVPGAEPVGAFVTEAAEEPPFEGREPPPPAPTARSSPDFLARTAGVRIPSSSCVSVSRKRDASQRMM